MTDKPEFIKVRARINLVSTEKGGRKTAIAPHYRPNHVFERASLHHVHSFIGEITFDGPWIKPGEEREVSINFLKAGGVEKYLTVGCKWWIHEGSRLIGEGEILFIENLN